MATEQQNHLKSILDQSQGLVNEINQLEGQAKQKRDLLLKNDMFLILKFEFLLNP